MATEGAAGIHVPAGAAEGLRIAVISSSWNSEITDQLHRHAVRACQERGAYVDEWRVAGAMELPVVVGAALKNHDAVVATGCVIEGETAHFKHVCDSVTYGLSALSIEHGKAVGNGVLTVSTEEQAWERAGGEGAREDKGYDAAIAAIHTTLVLRDIVSFHA